MNAAELTQGIRTYWNEGTRNSKGNWFMEPGWAWRWGWQGGGGNYTSRIDAVDAALAARNDSMTRCPMCGSHEGRFRR